MNIGTQYMELIKQEMADIQDFYQKRMGSELPPLKEEVGHIAAELARVQNAWRDGEKRAILAKYTEGDRVCVPYGKYTGLDFLDMASVRSLLTAQVLEPSGLNPRMLEDWQVNFKAAMDSTTAGTSDELVDT